MRMRDVGSSTFSWATTIVTAPAPLGLYVAWNTPIDGLYDAAAIAVTASADAAALPKTVKRTDLPMAPSFVMSPAVPAQTQIRPESCIAKYEWPLLSLVQSRDERAGHRCLRLRHGRAHGPPRVLGDDAARGFRLPRRPRPPAVRPSAAGRRSLRRRDDCGGARVRKAVEGRGNRHRHPRLHALPADPAGVPACLRPWRDTGLLGRGDGARGRRDAGSQGDRERGGARRVVPVSHHR